MKINFSFKFQPRKVSGWMLYTQIFMVANKPMFSKLEFWVQIKWESEENRHMT